MRNEHLSGKILTTHYKADDLFGDLTLGSSQWESFWSRFLMRKVSISWF